MPLTPAFGSSPLGVREARARSRTARSALIWEIPCKCSKEWSYEKEWRGIHQKAGTLFGYEADALKGVYFGPDIERQALEIICLVLLGQNEQVEFWKGQRSEDLFKVEFTPFTYTSYLEARNQGLR
jgi:hypothetical protein